MTRPCSVCRATATRSGNKFWPLCSERCHLIDLGRWLGEEYRVPAEPDTSGGGVDGLPDPDEGA